jgi:hypothetical protein
MSTLHLNVGSFLVASIVVLVLSYALLQIGAFADGPGEVVYAPTATPAVLEATSSPAP